MAWKTNFSEGKEIILSTCSNECEPNANVVISLGFVDNKLIIADCQMNGTIKNLKENSNACIISGYIRLKGTAEIYDSGKYFDFCKNKSKGYKVKNAIAITINEAFDLDKGKSVINK